MFKYFSVPTSTLQTGIKKKEKDVSNPLIGLKLIFCRDDKESLANPIIKLSIFFYVMTLKKMSFSRNSNQIAKTSESADKD